MRLTSPIVQPLCENSDLLRSYTFLKLDTPQMFLVFARGMLRNHPKYRGELSVRSWELGKRIVRGLHRDCSETCEWHFCRGCQKISTTTFSIGALSRGTKDGDNGLLDAEKVAIKRSCTVFLVAFLRLTNYIMSFLPSIFCFLGFYRVSFILAWLDRDRATYGFRRV